MTLIVELLSKLDNIDVFSLALASMEVKKISFDFYFQNFHTRTHIFNQKGTSEDWTTWAIAKDLTNNIMYIRAHDYISIRSINMNKLPNNSSVWMMLEGSFDDSIKDVTSKMVN